MLVYRQKKPTDPNEVFPPYLLRALHEDSRYARLSQYYPDWYSSPPPEISSEYHVEGYFFQDGAVIDGTSVEVVRGKAEKNEIIVVQEFELNAIDIVTREIYPQFAFVGRFGWEIRTQATQGNRGARYQSQGNIDNGPAKHAGFARMRRYTANNTRMTPIIAKPSETISIHAFNTGSGGLVFPPGGIVLAAQISGYSIPV